VIKQPAQRRMSLTARVDRVVSTLLALAFLVSGFQTGYRLTHSAGRDIDTSIAGTPREEPSSGSELPLDTPVPVIRPLPVWQGTARIHLLLMGLDRRPGSASPARADTIMIASVDPVQGKAVLISIPRDLWVEIPGHGEDRINSAHFYGELSGTEGAGPGLMRRTIEHNLGLSVDYYARLDFGCFKRIIDIVGGITIDVPEPIRDDRYPDDHYGHMRIYIPAGRQHMDGEMALQYVRARHESSDFSRMRRQQQVLLAVRDKALRLDIIPSLPELIPLLGRTFSTDLPLEHLLGLANLASQIQVQDVQLRVIDESLTVPYVAPDGAQVLLPKVDRIRAMLREIVQDIPPSWEHSGDEVGEPRVLVRADGTRPGLAVKVADLLQRRGYDARAQSDGIQIESEGTFIASRREMAETAVLISALLQVGAELVILGPDVEDGTDIVVTLGRAFVMP
jgi:LCP family protein required for cell wall assembly